MTCSERSQSVSEFQSVTSTSESLLAQLRENEPQAWERLVTLYTPLVYYWCRKLDVPPQDIPDVVQETFKAVARNVYRFRKQRTGDTFRGWLRTITRSKVMDYYRRGANEPRATGGTAAQLRFSQFPADVPGDDPEEDEVQSVVFRQALAFIRSHFGDHTWQAFWRVVVEGQSTDEVAQALSMQPGTVRVAKCRVLRRLRQELGELIE